MKPSILSFFGYAVLSGALLALGTLSARAVTFDYEATLSSSSFSSSGQTWTLTGNMANVAAAGFGAPAVGAASPASNGYMDTGFGTARPLI